jgi:hypothetical protein
MHDNEFFRIFRELYQRRCSRMAASPDSSVEMQLILHEYDAEGAM